jgi:hypothetical protein
MKKLFLFSAIVLCAVTLRAQPGTLSLNLDAGYNFASTVNLDGGTIKPQGALQYGGGFEFFTFWDQSVEIKYLRSDPSVNVSYYINSARKDYTTTGSQNYILLGWNKYFGANPEAKAVPFGGIGLGMNIIGNGNSSATKFSWDAKLGVKIKTNSAVSLKLQAYLEHSLSAVGTDIWYGWYGAYPVTTYAALWQFGLGGVLCFDFKRK